MVLIEVLNQHPEKLVIDLKKTILSGNSEDLSTEAEWRNATLPWG